MIKGYKELEGMNISTLPYIITNPSKVKSIYEGKVESKQTQYFDIGSLTDALLTTPDAVKNDYAILDRDVSPSMNNLVKEFMRLKELDTFSTIDTNSLILTARNNVEYDKRLKDETVISKFSEEGMFYLQFLKANKNKTIVSKEDFNLCTSLRDDVLNDPICSLVLKSNNDTEVLFQHSIQWFYNTGEGNWNSSNNIDTLVMYKVLCKGLIDFIRKSVLNKSIAPYDIKTYDSTYGSFIKSYYTYKYYYQGTFYTMGLKNLYPNYFISPFKFLAIDKSRRIPPLIYEMPTEHFEIAMSGGNMRGIPVVGIESMLKDFSWHVREGFWDYPREYYENQAILIP